MKKVLVFGTFDGIHEGHLDFFRQAREYGDYLITVVARDVNIKNNKGHQAKKNEQERLYDLKNCKPVDEAILGKEGDVYKIIEEINPDVICLGYDQNHYTKNLETELKNRKLNRKVYRMKSFRPEKYHSSILNKDK